MEKQEKEHYLLQYNPANREELLRNAGDRGMSRVSVEISDELLGLVKKKYCPGEQISRVE